VLQGSDILHGFLVVWEEKLLALVEVEEVLEVELFKKLQLVMCSM
jgi:hypothetical protein